jgi:hypothetical protein
MHPPDAAGREYCLAAVSLPALQVFDSLVPESPADYVDVPWWEMPQLQRAYIHPLFPG